MYYRIKIGFLHLNNAKLLIFAKHIFTMLTGNANYPTPNPTLAALGTAIQNYENGLKKSDGGKYDSEVIKQTRDILLGTLRQLGLYCELNGHNDPVIMTSSGFDLYTSQKSDRAAPTQPSIVKISDGGNSGEIKLKIASDAVSLKSFVRWTTDPKAGVWEDGGGFPRTRALIKGLTPNVTYYFCVRSWNNAGFSSWSQPVSRIVN